MKTIAVVALLAACGGLPPPKLICHNANCVDGTTIDADDSIAALTASLALRTADGGIVLDGVELDSVWDRALGRCTFTHAPDPSAIDLMNAANVVTMYVDAASPNGAAHGVPNGTTEFYFKIELKTDVGGGAEHTPDEVGAHVACVTQAAQAVIAAGDRSQNTVIPIFDSDDPNLLAAIDPTVFVVQHDPPVLFETGWSATLPAGFTPYILTLGWYEAPQELDWDRYSRVANADDPDSGLLIWARSPPPQDLYAMFAHQPAFIGVNNALEARGVIDADNSY